MRAAFARMRAVRCGVGVSSKALTDDSNRDLTTQSGDGFHHTRAQAIPRRVRAHPQSGQKLYRESTDSRACGPPESGPRDAGISAEDTTNSRARHEGRPWLRFDAANAIARSSACSSTRDSAPSSTRSASGPRGSGSSAKNNRQTRPARPRFGFGARWSASDRPSPRSARCSRYAPTSSRHRSRASSRSSRTRWSPSRSSR